MVCKGRGMLAASGEDRSEKAQGRRFGCWHLGNSGLALGEFNGELWKSEEGGGQCDCARTAASSAAYASCISTTVSRYGGVVGSGGSGGATESSSE
jgi:hypothetical protein